MKRKITLLFLAASATITVNAQLVLQENFTAPMTSWLNASATGWTVTNQSVPTGTAADQGWQQGCTIALGGNNIMPTAYNGNGGAGGDFASVGTAGGFSSIIQTTSGQVSNWLISPAVTIQDGYVFQFATRTGNTQSFNGGTVNVSPDRLQLRMSTTGSAYTSPAGPTGIGSFNTLLFDVNPAYSTSTVGAVVNGTTTNGYRQNGWTVYTVQITGVPTPVTGRFAFRYFVENAAASGSISSTQRGLWIGIDGVKYTGPCITPTVSNYTTCANTTVTMTTQGGAGTHYQWEANGVTTFTTPPNTSPIFTTPGSGTTVFTITAIDGTNLCANEYTTASVTVGNNLVFNAVASPSVYCPDELEDDLSFNVNPVWSSIATSYSIFAPSNPTSPGTQNYTITLYNGTCSGNAVTPVSVLPAPTITTAPLNGLCTGMNGTVTLAVSGGTLYAWNVELLSSIVQTTSNLNITASATMNIPAGTYTYAVVGQGSNGCISEIVNSSFDVHPTPTISIVSPITTGIYTLCPGVNTSFSATGIGSFSWSALVGSGTISIAVENSTLNPLTFTASLPAGSASQYNATITVNGTSDEGCPAAPKSMAIRVVKAGCDIGIGDINENSAVSVYPNPFTNELHITALNGRVEIYNTLGQLVINVAVKENGAINTDNLVKGVYILKAFNEKGQEVKATKLMKY
ncbi:MAG: T9SS type A sorting domain-containing protein [Bacteroidetes bacterium]|nr:T9SS type A sorting domain-containing protein [Bacteroidota bacterium]